MKSIYEFIDGDAPLLVSVPHDGPNLSDGGEHKWSSAAIDHPDRDWHVSKLYEFATDLGASLIVANYSRYVVDLNRPPTDETLYPGQIATGLVPKLTFDGEPLYADLSEPDGSEVKARVDSYWLPYHKRIASELVAIRGKHGYALLWDAHSIMSEVPSLFDGELPVLNIGTFDGASCSAEIAAAVEEAAKASDFDLVVNGRFKGGYITRHYGQPDENVHSIQLEIAQRAYMDEKSRAYDESRAGKLRTALRAMLRAYVDAAAKHYG